ncbi:hypothetical protein BT96DRAFT_1018634 [Gymnopus androsaceus JB14]|uniref:Ubiquitin 3 binding protein But2 C-terminal domain-containing protein n=1 Tax=Gymnopus androsaceus JB14 TaxID=1447944 RepID=A0A6A4HRT1_9AGAR|nr:hypothetical protein BT96DRAFT_1018634 [Gymnopus androsaceus JB14]
MAHPRTNFNYESLAQEDQDISEFKTPIKPVDGTVTSRFIYWAIVVVTLCTIFDAALIFFVTYRYALSASPPSPLERPSTYINFENLYRNGTRPKTKHGAITSLTKVQTQTSRVEPERVLPHSNEMWMTYYGSVPIGDRRLKVTGQISTIAQSRVLDWGMENCSLVITVPALNDTSLIVSESHIDSQLLDVWALESTNRKLNVRQISYKTKPSRQKLLGSLQVEFGNTYELQSWNCKAGTYQTFELVCSGDDSDCSVDLTTVGEIQAGIYMRQYQTV